MNIIKKRVWQTQYMHIKRQTYLFDAYTILIHLAKVGVAGTYFAGMLLCVNERRTGTTRL